jgi:endonuclease/exonuclease/phosphatase family metal-dependent hydrolase
MSFTIFQANMQHGEGTDGVTSYSRQTAILTAADIVCMQERTTGDTGWNSGMSGFTEAVTRENDPSQGDGPSIWCKNSTVAVNTTYQHDLSQGAIGWDGTTNVDKAAVAANITINGTTMLLVCTHLAWSAGADSNGSTYSAIRVAQITELLNWIDNTIIPTVDVLIVGDMNFGPDYPKSPSGLQIDLFTANYTDLWAQGLSRGTASANWGGDMPLSSLLTRTHDTRRIDYFFLNKTANLRMEAIDIPDLRVTCSTGLTGSPLYCPDTDPLQRWGIADDFGVRPSDHNWVKATFHAGSTITVRGKKGLRA